MQTWKAQSWEPTPESDGLVEGADPTQGTELSRELTFLHAMGHGDHTPRTLDYICHPLMLDVETYQTSGPNKDTTPTGEDMGWRQVRYTFDKLKLKPKCLSIHEGG